MADKAQTEGITDANTQTHSQIQASENPDRIEIERGNNPATTQLQLADLIQEEYSSPQRPARDNRGPQIIREKDPPNATPLQQLTENPTWIDCPFCKKRTKTKVTKEGTATQSLVGFILCLCCVCLACLPCMCGWFEITYICCSSCNARVATIPVDGPLQLAPREGNY
ncbi:hypothetical protein F4804DRAFT_310302 [Jackrogersella minutella]|nr:hypothetical protein F4804DRAFT_310302 [Jackrogersella minutella]